MQRYIEQLIEDLEQVAKNPPSPVYIEAPPHLDDSPDIAELALVPFKPISEWTGIAPEVFPDMTDLSGDEWGRVNETIFKVFDSLGLKSWMHRLIYLPNGFTRCLPPTGIIRYNISSVIRHRPRTVYRRPHDLPLR